MSVIAIVVLGALGWVIVSVLVALVVGGMASGRNPTTAGSVARGDAKGGSAGRAA